jgi:hypothetical protein
VSGWSRAAKRLAVWNSVDNGVVTVTRRQFYLFLVMYALLAKMPLDNVTTPAIILSWARLADIENALRAVPAYRACLTSVALILAGGALLRT